MFIGTLSGECVESIGMQMLNFFAPQGGAAPKPKTKTAPALL
jgi:hypothetical protein